MLSKPRLWNRLSDILTNAERTKIKDADLVAGSRHPTWFPLFAESPRVVDALCHVAVARIAEEMGGKDWLRALAPRLHDLAEPSHGSAALAELRAYGGLLEAGFNVTPIPRKNVSTPDFIVNAGDGEVVVEVFAKHQDKAEDELLKALHSSASSPPGVHRSTHQTKRAKITTSLAVLTPGGKPDPAKPGDSVQANVISRLCSVKQDESQLPADKPSILILDLANFGGRIVAELLGVEQTSPLISGHTGYTCGAIWNAFYGWKGAPLLEEGNRRVVEMGHEGRFRISGNRKSKLAGVVVVLAEDSVLLENPWASQRLPAGARFGFARYPWFNLSHSIADWQPNDAMNQVDLHQRQIEVFVADMRRRGEEWRP